VCQNLKAFKNIIAPISPVFDFQVLVFLTPETPAWLASHGRPSDAQESFRWLRGHGSEAAAELQALMQKQHEHLSTGSSSSADWLQQLLRASFIKPFLIMNVFFVIQQFSGVNAVAFYTVSIQKYSCKRLFIMNHPGSFDPIAIHIHIQLTGFSFPKIKTNDNLKKLYIEK
jgi:Sugar (and other) transporter